MDITYIPMARGFLYLAVALDWATRPLLSWRLSITMEARFALRHWMIAPAIAWHQFADTLLSTPRVALELDWLVTERGKPKIVVNDDSSELNSRVILTWVDQSHVAWLLPRI